MREICQIFKMRAGQSMFLKMREFHGKCVKVGRAAVNLVSLLLTYFIFCSSIAIVNFEEINADWENIPFRLLLKI